MGDFNGVGLEVALKALADENITELFTPVLFADGRLVEHARNSMSIEMPKVRHIAKASDLLPGHINLIDLHLSETNVEPGQPTRQSGKGAVESLERAMEALKAGHIDALVTAPISKEAAQGENFRFAGHTEYLNHKAGNGHKAQMILFDDLIRVALVTTHLPISDVAQFITRENVGASIRNFNHTLRQDFGITRPKIAVLSLNPHVGDGGLLGSEETDAIKPAIDDVNSEDILAFGPYAADGFFGNGTFHHFDGILAMYHDQGLAPFKAIARENGVNFTAGLPFVRTSPDHGTAYDIAWKGEADASSMREAIYKAVDIVRNRKRFLEASANPLKKHQTDKPRKNEDRPSSKQNSESPDKPESEIKSKTDRPDSESAKPE